MPDEKHLTTDAGIPVPDNQNSLTAGQLGPVLLEDFMMVEKNAHFNRERVPERVVHAKGAGAFGYFKLTKDMSAYTKAGLFNGEGKTTDLLIRFSTVAGEMGSADAERDPRGFAMKFYTDEGNYDLVGNNTPIFFVRDGQKFPDFIHSQKRNTQTNLREHTAMWDFWSLSPESAHQVTFLFTDRGTPANFRHMDGFSSHAFSWINAQGERFWVKYHFKTKQGIKNFTRQEADEMKGKDPDHATRDLFESIEKGDFPGWTAYVQIMPEAEAWNYHINPFDLTKVWPHGDYPLIEFGEFFLNRNPTNYFAQIEQASFEPTNVVPGIGFSPDKMLQARIFSYPDTHRHRIGPNYLELPVNRPRVPVNNYNRAGSMRYEIDPPGPNYEPNSFNGPKERADLKTPAYGFEASGAFARWDHREYDDDYFSQPGIFFREVLDDAGRAALIGNMVDHMSVVPEEIQLRAIRNFYKCDPAYGEGLAKGLGISVGDLSTAG